MRTAAARRTAVREILTAAGVSERRACRFTGFARSTHRYQPTRDDTALRARLETFAILKPRWGSGCIAPPACTFRIFTLVDDCSRESPGLFADFSLGADRVTRFLDELPVRPTDFVCDNGPAFTSQHFDQWAHARGTRLH